MIRPFTNDADSVKDAFRQLNSLETEKKLFSIIEEYTEPIQISGLLNTLLDKHVKKFNNISIRQAILEVRKTLSKDYIMPSIDDVILAIIKLPDDILFELGKFEVCFFPEVIETRIKSMNNKKQYTRGYQSGSRVILAPVPANEKFDYVETMLHELGHLYSHKTGGKSTLKKMFDNYLYSNQSLQKLIIYREDLEEAFAIWFTSYFSGK